MNKTGNSPVFKMVLTAMMVVSLIAVRLFERQWFPEVFQDYFGSGHYLNEALPPVGFSDIFSMMFRYAVNSVFSIVLLYIWFPDRPLIRMVIRIYLYAGLFLFILLMGAIWLYRPGHYIFLFYVRRFLIQPLLLFVLVPLLLALGRPAGESSS